MKIENAPKKPEFGLTVDDLVEGSTYISQLYPEEVFIYTDEGRAVDLSDGTQWSFGDEERFREVRAKVVIE